MEYGEHFKALFRELEEAHGRLDRKVVGAIVGFWRMCGVYEVVPD